MRGCNFKEPEVIFSVSVGLMKSQLYVDLLLQNVN